MRPLRAIAVPALPLVGLVAALAGCGGPTGKGGTIQVTASGESLALGGYDYPPTAGGESVAFVDGWEVRFSHFIVVLDAVTLSETPDRAPADPSQTGPQVAALAGPWVVDLHLGGPLGGKGGSGEQAFPVGVIPNQTLRGGAELDDTVRYAFGFSTVPASASATQLALDSEGQALYQQMIARGQVALYAGTATWKGGSCGSTIPGYDFSSLPTEVDFTLGFTSPTTYVNCQNPDNDPARPIEGEEHQRGVQVKRNATTIAQITMHTDHAFWDSFTHDAPLHFDQLAALARQQPSGRWAVTLDDAVGVDYKAFRDRAGRPLPYRQCLPGYTPPTGATQLSFDSLGIAHLPGGDPTQVMRDYADFVTYDQSTQGHLNADGLCFVQRNYPSPP